MPQALWFRFPAGFWVSSWLHPNTHSKAVSSPFSLMSFLSTPPFPPWRWGLGVPGTASRRRKPPSASPACSPSPPREWERGPCIFAGLWKPGRLVPALPGRVPSALGWAGVYQLTQSCPQGLKLYMQTFPVEPAECGAGSRSHPCWRWDLGRTRERKYLSAKTRFQFHAGD